MSLRQLLARKRMVILGLNSGTSADGLDLAVLEISPSHVTPAKYLAGKCVAYPPHLRDAVLTLSDAHTADLNHLVYLDHALGEFYGTAAARFQAWLSHRGITIDAIGSHGQTVRHLPAPTTFLGRRVHGTLQIGSLEMIATLTGKPVIGDFRQADVALGHEGAPITVAAMARLFGHPSRSRLIVNIGGMANYFYFPAGFDVSEIRAADTGPGNVLSDLLCRT
ncbi:anhydro-N-acetylmuramic acid kinase, partial [candidate division GN15 bacterium]